MAEFQIRDLRKADEPSFRGPYWKARVVQGNLSLQVDLKYGSWQVVLPDGHRADVHPAVARALQAKVRPLERKAQRAAA